ncbi:MAG: hypothetical protein E7329_03245 [Clostridiales bacterium]|nr:hypothetical protein [Clostridiales bacterium]
MNRLGVQLYTVREQLKDENERNATLQRLKKVGCHTAQLFGPLDMAKEYAGACAAQGIRVIGYLGNLDGFEKEEKALFAFCREYDIGDIGVSSNVKTCEEAMQYIHRVNRFAKKARDAGFTFSYHNHSNEWMRTSCQKTVMELFLEGFDRENVFFMPDTYWLQHGGVDVRHFLERTGSRVKILHLKDMTRGENGPVFAEVGYGNLWFEGILKTALEAGIEEYVIEQDQCAGDPVKSVEMSLSYLRGLNML